MIKYFLRKYQEVLVPPQLFNFMSFHDNHPLMMVNDDPSLTIINTIVNNIFFKNDRFLKNNHIKMVANCFTKTIDFKNDP